MPENETEVAEGLLKGQTLKQLIKKFKGDFIGNKVYDIFGNDFPLLMQKSHYLFKYILVIL